MRQVLKCSRKLGNAPNTNRIVPAVAGRANMRIHGANPLFTARKLLSSSSSTRSLILPRTTPSIRRTVTPQSMTQRNIRSTQRYLATPSKTVQTRRSFFSENEKINIGFIGTGVMGRWMCEHVMKHPAINKTFLFNRTQAKAQPLIDQGAIFLESPYFVGQHSDIVFTMVGYPNDVERTILGQRPEPGESGVTISGVLDGLCEAKNRDHRRKIVVDFTSSSPTLADRIYHIAQTAQIEALDCPVSGGDVGAKNATLTMMAGGDEKTFETVLPLLEKMGKTVVHMGKAGLGQHAKLANQIKIAGVTMGLIECFQYADKAGLDKEKLLKAVSAGSAGSWSLTNYGPRILKGDYEPGFMAHHFLKDLRMVAQESQKFGIENPATSAAILLLRMLTEDMGMSNKGIHAMYLAIKDVNKKKEVFENKKLAQSNQDVQRLLEQVFSQFEAGGFDKLDDNK